MKRLRASLCTGVMLLVTAVSAHAEVYRCVDTEGNVIFSQKRCDPSQQGEKVDMEGTNVNKKPTPEVCHQIKKLAELIFPYVAQTDSILDMYTNLGGRKHLSAGVTAAVNYVYNFHYNPKAKQAEVVELTHDKCLDGGFGLITQSDLPDWNRINYVKEKPKEQQQSEQQTAELAKSCQEYNEKIKALKQRMAKAKDKSEKLQSQVDKEYYEGLVKEKCSKAQK